MRDFVRGLGSWGCSARVARLLGFWLACACSLTLDDYRIVDPQGGAGGAAGRDEPGFDAGAGRGVTPVNGDTDASLAGAGGTGATGGSSAGGNGGAAPARTRATWDGTDTLWDTATWN